MKRFFRYAPVVAALVCLLGVLPVFAVEDADPAVDPGDSSDTVTLESAADDKNITVNITMPTAVPTPSEGDSTASEEAPVELEADPEPLYIPYSEFTLDALERASDPEALPTVIEALFGEYTPRTQTVTEYLADGSSVTYQQYVPGVAGMDWTWLAGVGLFALCLLSFFKIVGGVLKRG